MKKWKTIFNVFLAIKETSETVIEHHKQIVEAIENHTEEEGVAIMAEHIEYQMLEILQHIMINMVKMKMRYCLTPVIL